ncbi:MAG: glycoside hydrolase family 88 protein [Paludibacteraceae bacterium]|nr:glycoside hydrolase family 88 protein [Paludibacteraceae bacterium]
MKYYKTFFIAIVASLSTVSCTNPTASTSSFSSKISTEAVTAVTDAAVKWQIKHYNTVDAHRRWKRTNDVNWADAIFLTAAYEWALHRNDSATIYFVDSIMQLNDYRLPMGVHVYHADNIIVSMLYADMYEHTGDRRFLHQPVERLEFIMNHPSKCTLYSNDNDPTYYYKQRWSWCDALYMAPQVFARYASICNNPQMLSFMDAEYHSTTDYLYSKQFHLYWRDSNYFDKHEANGNPVFWGRGNGWVTAGLAKMIPYLPDNFKPKEWYIAHFKEMMQTIVTLQAPQGHWGVSMLDLEAYPTPEMSSTAFFCYALWWGINSNILDEATYLPHAVKAWQAIVRSVHADGMLGSVQAVGEKPEAITADMTEVYGPAAMYYAAQQILIYIENKDTMQ